MVCPTTDEAKLEFSLQENILKLEIATCNKNIGTK